MGRADNTLPSGEGWSYWPAPAKLNLFLHITGRRADGYHELQTVFRLLNWGDTIALRRRDDGAIQRHGNALMNVSQTDDLTLRAALALQHASNTHFGADIFLQKRIPIGAGFGGGSSDAATVLVALNALWRTDLDTDTLAAIGLTLGADVPVFVRGHSAFAEGVGEKLQPLTLPPAWYVLADPQIHVATKALFAAPDLTRNTQPVTMRQFVCGDVLGNAFEPVLRRREAAVDKALQVLSKVGQGRLTGSGSGCFIEFASAHAAQLALAKLPKSLRAWVAQGVNSSPLLDALQTKNNV